MDQQSTEEIFLENQRCELELELAALSMIYNSGESFLLEQAEMYHQAQWSDEQEEDSDDSTRYGAPEEHIPDDEDCVSLQAQLQQMRLQISESTISSGSRRSNASKDKKSSKRARKLTHS